MAIEAEEAKGAWGAETCTGRGADQAPQVRLGQLVVLIQLVCQCLQQPLQQPMNKGRDT